MHDPNVVAFEIRRPWPYRSGKRWYWPSLITIWHRDPEADGSDDSCGWSAPRLTKEQRSRVEWLAGCEARSPWFRREAAKEPASPADAEALLRGGLLAVARLLRVRMSIAQATEAAISLVHNPSDNIRSHLCLLPGYHTNDVEDSAWWRERESQDLFYILARVVLHRARPWWRHPRWHAWHWRIQVHPLQNLKRWVWSRCCRCGGRFRWGESVVSCSWHGSGPRWFRGETDIFHSSCDRLAAVATKEPHHA